MTPNTIATPISCVPSLRRLARQAGWSGSPPPWPSPSSPRSPTLPCHWFAHVNCGNLTDLCTASLYCASAPAQRRCHQARS